MSLPPTSVAVGPAASEAGAPTRSAVAIAALTAADRRCRALIRAASIRRCAAGPDTCDLFSHARPSIRPCRQRERDELLLSLASLGGDDDVLSPFLEVGDRRAAGLGVERD